MKLLKQLSHELEDLMASAAPAVVGVEHRRGQGTGLILARDGYILTNAHVVHGFDQLRIRLHTGATVKGELVGADDRTIWRGRGGKPEAPSSPPLPSPSQL